MSSSIIPSFDFTVNQRPTKALMTQQANSLVITGLGVAELPDTLGILGGDTSGTTGTMQAGEDVGMMWVSPDGSLWVQEQSGPVVMKTYSGGWESRRYFIRTEDSGTNDDPHPGIPISGSSGGVGNTYAEDHERSETPVPLTNHGAVLRATNNPGLNDNRNGRYMGFSVETTVSEHARWSGRGGCLIKDHKAVVGGDLNTTYNEVRNSIVIGWAGGSFTPRVSLEKDPFDGTLTETRSQCWIADLGAGGSIVSDGAGNHTLKLLFYGWNYGLPLMTRTGAM